MRGMTRHSGTSKAPQSQEQLVTTAAGEREGVEIGLRSGARVGPRWRVSRMSGRALHRRKHHLQLLPFRPELRESVLEGESGCLGRRTRT